MKIELEKSDLTQRTEGNSGIQCPAQRNILYARRYSFSAQRVVYRLMHGLYRPTAATPQRELARVKKILGLQVNKFQSDMTYVYFPI